MPWAFWERRLLRCIPDGERRKVCGLVSVCLEAKAFTGCQGLVSSFRGNFYKRWGQGWGIERSVCVYMHTGMYVCVLIMTGTSER